MSLSFNSKPFNSYINADDNLVLEVGVAGFSEEDLDITRVGTQLYVSGQKSDKPVEVRQFFNRGLSYRDFKDMFVVPVQFKLLSAELINGVLRIKFFEEKETLPITVKLKPSETAKQIADKAIEKAKLNA